MQTQMSRPFINPRAAFPPFLLKKPQPRLLKWFRAASPQQDGTTLHDYPDSYFKVCAFPRDLSCVSIESEPLPHQAAKTRALVLRSPEPRLHCVLKSAS